MGAAGWSKCWYDIGTGVPAGQKSLLLGGEMSMWSDTYCCEWLSSLYQLPSGHRAY